VAEVWQPHVLALARELKSLVGYGITASKTATALPHLKRVLGVPGDERQPTIQRRLKQRLRDELHKLDGRFDVFDPPVSVAATDLRAAYECLFHLVTPVEVKTYLGLQEHERRRKYAIDRLKAPYPLRSWRLPDGPELQLMLVLARRLTEIADPEEGFITESAEMRVTMDELGVTKHVTVIGAMRATRDGVDHGKFFLHYKPDPRSDVYEIEFIEGLSLRDEEWNETTGTKIVTAQFGPLNVGDTLTYIYRLTLNTQKGIRSTIYHAPDSDYAHCKTQVEFSGARLPRDVWWFERLGQFEIPGPPSPERVLLPRFGNTYVREWTNVPGGYCCGLGWHWEAE
jgi:hypothetical protein